MARLGDVCILINGDRGKNYPSKEEMQSEGVPFINAGHLKSNCICFDEMNYISEEKFSKLSSGKIQNGDLLYCLRGSLGKKAIVDGIEKGAVASSLVIIRPATNFLRVSYLSYVLDSPTIQEQMQKANNGSSQPNLSADSVKNFEFQLPSLEKQDAAVSILDKVSNLITLRKKQLGKLDELVKARFVEMFGSTKSNHQGYPIVKIGSCAKLQGGFAFKSSDYLEEGIRLVQISNVNKDTLDWDNVNHVPQSFLQKYIDFQLHVGDLVLAMTRPVIKSLAAVKIATVSRDDVPSLLNQRVGRFLIDKSKLDSIYLMVLCQMPEFREYVEAMSGNSLQPNISSKQVEEYSIVLPPLELQKQFAAFVEQSNKSKLSVQKSLDQLETLKKALMQKYFGL